MHTENEALKSEGKENGEIKRYREYLINEEKSEATVSKYIRDVRAFLDFAGREEPPYENSGEYEEKENGAYENYKAAPDYAENEKGKHEEHSCKACSISFTDSEGVYKITFDKAKVIEWKASLIYSYKVTSANSMLVALNGFLKFIGREDLKVRLYRCQKQSVRASENDFTRADYMKLLECARAKKHRLYWIMQTICSTGMRVSELQYIDVNAVLRGKAVIRNKGKLRVIFLSQRLRRGLKQYIRERGITSGSVFVTSKGSPVRRESIWREMKRLAGEAGIPEERVYPHKLRHLFARSFYGKYKDITGLADILGHSDINTTRRYTMISETEQQRRIEGLKLVL